MRKLVCCAMAVAGMATCVFAEEKGRSFFSSESLGVSMEVPVSAEAVKGSYLVATFLLPVKDGFSGNVSVIRQSFDGDLADYDKLSMDQFKAAGMNVSGRKVAAGEIVYEYRGEVRGRPMRYYARAMKAGAGEYYLLTGTCLESAWKEQGAKIVQSVNSFKVKQ